MLTKREVGLKYLSHIWAFEYFSNFLDIIQKELELTSDPAFKTSRISNLIGLTSIYSIFDGCEIIGLQFLYF